MSEFKKDVTEEGQPLEVCYLALDLNQEHFNQCKKQADEKKKDTPAFEFTEVMVAMAGHVRKFTYKEFINRLGFGEGAFTLEIGKSFNEVNHFIPSVLMRAEVLDKSYPFQVRVNGDYDTLKVD